MCSLTPMTHSTTPQEWNLQQSSPEQHLLHLMHHLLYIAMHWTPLHSTSSLHPTSTLSAQRYLIACNTKHLGIWQLPVCTPGSLVLAWPRCSEAPGASPSTSWKLLFCLPQIWWICMAASRSATKSRSCWAKWALSCLISNLHKRGTNRRTEILYKLCILLQISSARILVQFLLQSYHRWPLRYIVQVHVRIYW